MKPKLSMGFSLIHTVAAFALCGERVKKIEDGVFKMKYGGSNRVIDSLGL